MTSKSQTGFLLILVFVVVGWAGGPLSAQAPNTMSFTGTLVTPQGDPRDGAFSMTFRVYNAPAGGTNLHTQTINGVIVRQGQFSVLLSGFPSSVFQQGGGERYVEVQVGSETPVLPRQHLISAPFAQRAGRLDSIDGAQGGSIQGDIALFGKHAFRGSDGWLRLNQDRSFGGVHVNSLFAPVSLNVGGIGSWGNPGDGNAVIAGNVGIGTTDPQSKLHVSAPFGVAGMTLQGDHSGIRHVDGAGNAKFITGIRQDVAGTNNFTFFSYGGNWLFANGSVGIGTLDTVDAKLNAVCSSGCQAAIKTELHNSDGNSLVGATFGGGTGVWGAAFDGGRAGYFSGNVQIVGRLTKSSGSFQIDHPLDPANKYLSHSFVESPDMMNIYNGNVVLDANGEAVVILPEWFEALNRDFRYQLSAIGAPGPNLHVAEKVSGNRFKIAGGQQGLEVSWQVTGIRKDPYAERYRIAVEEEKPADERGYYLHPEVYGQPLSKSVKLSKHPEILKQLSEPKQQ